MRKKYRAWALVLAFVLMLAGCGPKEGTVTPEAIAIAPVRAQM